MAIDGMPIGQINPNREVPSNKLSFDAEELADVMINNNEVGEITSTKFKNINQKNDNYGEDTSNAMQGGTSGDEVTEEPIEDFDYEEEDLAGHKRYRLKFDKKSEVVQLYDNKKQCVIRVISEQNLIRLMAKLKYPSGIIFTDKV